MRTIGERIAELRKQKGMTQEELASVIGVSAQSVSKWENNTTMPDILLLPVIADIYGVTIDELYGKSSQKKERTISPDDLADEAYDTLLEIMQRAWNSDRNHSHSSMQTDKAAADTKKYLKENPDSQTVIFSEGTGAVYVNADIGLIFKKNAGNMSSLLTDENAAELLAALSDKTFRKIMEYQMKNNAISFTAASAANKCGIAPEEAQKALDKLVCYTLTTQKTIDMGDGRIDVYELCGGPKMLLVYAILKLAHRLSAYNEHYRGLRGIPNDWFC